MTRLHDVYEPSVIHRLATDRVISRGQSYHADGSVNVTSRSTTRIEAVITGTAPYRTVLDATGHGDWSCTCPAAEDGDFCKHCVALALHVAALDPDEFDEPVVEPPTSPANGSPTRRASSRPHSSVAERKRQFRSLRTHLTSLDHTELVDMVVERAEHDGTFFERMMKTADSPLDLDAWRNRIDDAMLVDDYVDWRQSARWSAGVEEVLTELDELIASGHASPVVGLAAHAFAGVEAAMSYVDDSGDGCLRELSERCGEIHLRACNEARPDPIALARQLFDLEINSELEGLYGALAAYVDILGTSGLAEYGRLLDQPTQRGESWTLKSMRTSYLELTGDVEGLVSALGTDPSSRDIITVIDALVGADRADEAIERGMSGIDRLRAVGRSGGVSNIIDSLAPLLLDDRRRADLLRLRWADFESIPCPRLLDALLASAEHDEERWIEVALGYVRTAAEDESQAGPRPRSHGDMLIELLLHLERPGDAWEAAKQFDTRPPTWVQLAQHREATHPVDAIDVYEPQIFDHIGQVNNGGYRSAVALMERVERLADQAGVPQRFADILTHARIDHKAKRNLQKLLDERRW